MSEVLNITRKSILDAIRKIDEKPSLRNKRESYEYDLLFNNKRYPPILVLSEANKIIGGKELTISDFGNSISRAFNIIENLEFIVVKKYKPFTKEIILDIIALCDQMVKGRESGVINQTTYSTIFRPQVDAFEKKYKDSPNLFLQNHLQNYYNAHLKDISEKIQFKNFSFWGRSIYNYVWSCIYYDFGAEVIPASFSPQLYILVNRFGIKFGFCYGHYITNEDEKVQSVIKDRIKTSLLKKCFDNDNELCFFNKLDTEITARPEMLFGQDEKILVKSESDIINNWSNGSLVIKELSKETIPDNIYEVIEETLINLKEFYLSLLPTKKEKNSIYILKNKPQEDFKIRNLVNDLNESGLSFNEKLLVRYLSSLLTKPFVILTGLSGSGKTKLAQSVVKWICENESQYCIVPVGADWTNREPLLGYPNALKPEEYVKPENGVLDLIVTANDHQELPHFLILDEMNLSHVERYFADFLSVMESKEEILLHSGEIENGVPAMLKVPTNLFIIGTVNIDETTNMFSPKVLDRANTIEFRVSQNEMKNFLGNIKDINMEALTGKGAGMAKSFLKMAASKEFPAEDIDIVNDSLVRFFTELKKTGAEFGYRSATEILRLINQLTLLDSKLSTNQKIDIAIMQKLLPKLHGSRRKLCPVLEKLGSFCIMENLNILKDVFGKDDFDFETNPNIIYPLSLEKIARMYKGAIDNGFTSFAEA